MPTTEQILKALLHADEAQKEKAFKVLTGDEDEPVAEDLAEIVAREIEKRIPQKPKERNGDREQINTARAAKILGYHPKYFCQKGAEWGQTKIHMSRRSVRWYLDEIEGLAESRSLNA